MALKAGRVGVAQDQVDLFGNIIGGSGDSYTKAETDEKFLTKLAAASDYATKSELDDYYTKTDVDNTLEVVVEQIYADNGVLGAKNWLRTPYYDGTTKTSHGATFTVNADGSVTIDTDGSPTDADATFRFLRYDADQDILNALNGKTVLLTGSSGDVKIQGFWGSQTYRDTGTGVKIDVNTSSMTNWNFALFVASGTTINNVTVYPMLRLASDPVSTYQPYAMTNKELTDDVKSVEESLPYYVGRTGVTVSSTASAVRIPSGSDTDSRIHTTSTIIPVSDSGVGYTDISVNEGYVNITVANTFSDKEIGVYVINN